MTNNYRGAEATVDIAFAEKIRAAAETAITEVLENTNLKNGDIFVVGCSSSEILGSKIGKGSSFEAAKIVFDTIYPKFKEKGIFLAAQCCEHLNRALVIERACAEKFGYEPVAVVPQPKAGGSFATLTYENMNDAVVVEKIRAHAGMDIGLTLIGMHLKDVAVPLRLSVNHIGEAAVVFAYTRPKFIGGSRATY